MKTHRQGSFAVAEVLPRRLLALIPDDRAVKRAYEQAFENTPVVILTGTPIFRPIGWITAQQGAPLIDSPGKLVCSYSR